MESRIFLDQCAGLITVEARHHDIDKDQLRLVIGDFGQRVETVFGEDDRASRLEQENLGAATNSVAIVDHHDFYTRQRARIGHSPAPCVGDQNRVSCD